MQHPTPRSTPSPSRALGAPTAALAPSGPDTEVHHPPHVDPYSSSRRAETAGLSSERRWRTLVPRRPILAAAAALSLLAAATACGSSPDKPVDAAAPSSSVIAETSTTPPPAPPVWPLTGTIAPDADVVERSAVAVKMDNSPDARPQTGLNEADIVYELLVEGITRYALVYQSELPEVVGPVRSARSSDPSLVSNLGTPLLVWSGGNAGVTGEVQHAADIGALTDRSYSVATAHYWRDGSRKAPHNLYANVAAIEAESPDGPPPPVFSFLAPGAASTVGGDAPGATVDYGNGVRADYVWDAERGGWDRFQVDERHPRDSSATVDSNGVQVAPQNVVVLFLEYGQSPSDARSPMAISTGGGEAFVFTNGKVVHGTWSRETPLHPWTLTDDAGQPIELTPGRTWVSLPEVGSTMSLLDPVAAGELLAVRS